MQTASREAKVWRLFDILTDTKQKRAEKVILTCHKQLWKRFHSFSATSIVNKVMNGSNNKFRSNNVIHV